jgi:hypothetical protein
MAAVFYAVSRLILSFQILKFGIRFAKSSVYSSGMQNFKEVFCNHAEQ